MNFEHIFEWAEAAAHCGIPLGFEYFLLPLHSLRTLHIQNHFKATFYWGRILGSHTNYFIAFGYREDILKDSKYFYSIDGVFWNLMPHVTEQTKELSLKCTSRLRGDPYFTIEVGDGGPEMDEDGFFNPDGALKEEDRLSATVHMITEESAVVPRGAIFRSHDGITIENPSFHGLSELEAPLLMNYYHLREPREAYNTRLRTSGDNNFQFDFLDSVDMDLPQDSWSLTFELYYLERLLILRSLLWPGMTFFHFISTPLHSFFYIGDGKKNMDIPFMMNLTAVEEEQREEYE